ncbi:MAG: NFACT family protein, partial [Bdellovibrionales bacterium]|nr:NFACT family protein [Oligoflexia bacterium]
MSTLLPVPRYPTLSFFELKTWVSLLVPTLLGARIERVLVPGTAEHPDLYFKKEWVFDLHLPQSSLAFYFSLRPQASGILTLPSKVLKSESTGSRSGFDLSLHKYLIGGKISGLKVIEGERIVILEISSSENYELHLHLIPTKPLGVLLKKEGAGLHLLAATDNRETYETPESRVLSDEAKLKIPNRSELTASIPHYQKIWFEAQKATALQQRRQRLAHVLQTQMESIQSKTRSLAEQLKKTHAEPDWNYFGSLLQVHFYSKPLATEGFFEFEDYEKDVKIKVPSDPKLNLKQQLEKFFHSAKRKKKRLEETAIRIASLNEKEEMLRGKIAALAD